MKYKTKKLMERTRQTPLVVDDSGINELIAINGIMWALDNISMIKREVIRDRHHTKRNKTILAKQIKE